MNHIFVLSFALALASTQLAHSTPLTLEKALQMARANSPELKAARSNILAAEKSVALSGRWINPELGIEAEGLGGDRGGLGDGEYTVALSQRFQRGGKRTAARKHAQQAIQIAEFAEAEKERILLGEVRNCFIGVVYQQELARVQEAQEELSRSFLAVAKSRLQAGGSSSLEVAQAELALQETLLENARGESQLNAQRAALASMIGSRESKMAALDFDLFQLKEMNYRSVASRHPSLLKIEAQIAETGAFGRLQKASDAADITLAAGYRFDSEADEGSFVLGASIPLNFTRAGATSAAVSKIRMDQLRAQKVAKLRLLTQKLAVFGAEFEGAKLEAQQTRNVLIPLAQKAHELSEEGYKAGRYSWVELIAAQNKLAEIRIREIGALRDAHLARSSMKQLMTEEF